MLRKLNCGYWAEYYETLLTKSPEIPIDTIDKHLSVPKEIQEQGASAVGKYLQSLKKGSVNLNETRLILLGNKGSGKTSLARRLNDPNAPMPKKRESTEGVSLSQWRVQEQNIRIWDFAGHVVTHALHRVFLSARCCYILVINGREENVDSITMWLNHIKTYGDNSPVFLFVNKRDQHSVEIPINELKDSYNIQGLVEINIDTDKFGLDRFREQLLDYLSQHTTWKNNQISKESYQVKQQLEQLFQAGTAHINMDHFCKIANTNNVSCGKDEQRLLQDLHVLGVALHYEKLKQFDKVILQPEWISAGIYKIINWCFEKKQYRLYKSKLDSIFEKLNTYQAKEDKDYLYVLLQEYQLAYEMDNEPTLILPGLLPLDRPKKLPAFSAVYSLRLEYHFPGELPIQILTRFIVKSDKSIPSNRSIEDVVWRHGVVLEDKEGAEALVRTKDRVLSIECKGKRRTQFLDILRERVDKLVDSYYGQKPVKKYRFHFKNESKDLLSDDYLVAWLEETTMRTYLENQEPYLFPKMDKKVDLPPFAREYYIQYLPKPKEVETEMLERAEENKYLELQSFLARLATTQTMVKRYCEQDEYKELLEETVDILSDLTSMLPRTTATRTYAELVQDGAIDCMHELQEVVNDVNISNVIKQKQRDYKKWIGLKEELEKIL